MISVRVNGKKIRIAILLNRKTTLTIGSTHSEKHNSKYVLDDGFKRSGGWGFREGDGVDAG
jgi:hypothetical protein